jgi:L-threonylcarbamoyladenylate synthase
VFPTDTVYGIGTNAFDQEAVLNLYKVKKRPFDKGIPILLADLADLPKVAIEVPKTAELLIARFWPGPLTLIVPKHPDLPAAISATSSVAVRIPANDIARSVIRQAGGAVAASSANVSGDEPAYSALTAMAAFRGAVSIVLDGGISGGNLASTIIDCTGQELGILREGPIKPAELDEVLSSRV